MSSACSHGANSIADRSLIVILKTLEVLLTLFYQILVKRLSFEMFLALIKESVSLLLGCSYTGSVFLIFWTVSEVLERNI